MRAIRYRKRRGRRRGEGELHTTSLFTICHQGGKQRRRLKNTLPSASMLSQRGRQCCWRRPHTKSLIKVLSLYFFFLPPYLLFLSFFLSNDISVHTERNVEDTRVKLSTSIEACKLTLKGSSVTYAISPSSAELIWKVLSSPLLSLSYFTTFCSPHYNSNQELNINAGPGWYSRYWDILCKSDYEASNVPLRWHSETSRR